MPRSTPFMANLPCYAFMAVHPVLAMFLRLGTSRDWVLNWVLAGAALLGLGASFSRPRGARGALAAGIATVAVLGLAAAMLGKSEFPHVWTKQAGPWIEAFKPVAYLLFAVAWGATFGLPDMKAVFRSAVALGLAVLLYLFLSGAVQDATPMQRIAALPGSAPLFLLLGLCAGMLSGKRTSFTALVLVLAGLSATLSFTGLAAAVLAVALIGPWGVPRNLGAALVLCLPLAAAFLLGPGRVPLEDTPNTWWSWIIGLDLFFNTPHALATGFPLAEPLPLSLSGTASVLLAHSDSTWASSAIHAGLITPFWLRLALNWGLGAVAGGVLALSALLLGRPSRLAAGLFLAMMLMGLSCALFYAPGQAVPCLLLALAARERYPDFTFEPIRHVDSQPPAGTGGKRHGQDPGNPA